MKKLLQTATLAAVASISLLVPAHASEVSIELLNKAGDHRFVFSPELVRIDPGDTVVFVPTDKGHNAVSIDGMLPEGAERINIGSNKGGAVAFDQPGIYGIKCTPTSVSAWWVSLLAAIRAAAMRCVVPRTTSLQRPEG